MSAGILYLSGCTNDKIEGRPFGGVVTRLVRFLRRLDGWLADRILSETVPFSPVCCSPVTARREVAGRADSAVCRPATPPTQPTTESRAE